MDDTQFKTFVATGFETRSIPVEYVVEAETAEEALDKMLEGSTLAERDTGMGQVSDRYFDLVDVHEVAEVPASPEAAASFDERLASALGIAVSGIELLDRVDSAVPVESRPGTARITTSEGTFLVTIRLEDFAGTD